MLNPFQLWVLTFKAWQNSQKQSTSKQFLEWSGLTSDLHRRQKSANFKWWR